MTPGSARAAEDWHPAPYGSACANCVRAKCKCFVRSDGPSCERCVRLGKPCLSTSTVRKRKPEGRNSRAQKTLHVSGSLQNPRDKPKRSEIPLSTPGLTPTGPDTASSSSTVQTGSNTGMQVPNFVIDTAANTFQFERPPSPTPSTSPILDDISLHRIPDELADDQLAIFRDRFLPMFPCLHIPASMSSAELRGRRPFVWLVIMGLTCKVVAQQFVMADTIWLIISRRVLTQRFVDLDVLLGLICFSSWSHYFKEDKPYMSMTTNLAVSVAFELNLHKDVPSLSTLQEKPHRIVMMQSGQQHPRTLEERRALLALYHLSFSTWRGYRKMEPLRWTSYMDTCLQILSSEGEAPLDAVLVVQIKCQLIDSQLLVPELRNSAGEPSSMAPSIMVGTAILAQVNDMKKKLPAAVQSKSASEISTFVIAELILEGSVQFYQCMVEISVHEYRWSRPKDPDPTGTSQIQLLGDLETLLGSTTRAIELMMNMPMKEWLGITTDVFVQFMHCIVVLFKLTILDEPGWAFEEVKRRADVFAVLDQLTEAMQSATTVLGIEVPDGDQRGINFKTVHLLRSLKALFLTEAPSEMLFRSKPTGDSGAADAVSAAIANESEIPDDFWLGLLDEPWLSDMLAGPGGLV